jgi:biotin operon repressor
MWLVAEGLVWRPQESKRMNTVVKFPARHLKVYAEQISRLFKEDPEEFNRRFNVPKRAGLTPEGNKTESVYRWLRVGKPKSLSLMVFSLGTSDAAVKAIISDLRFMGATIVSMKKRGRIFYKMEDGPHTYAGLKRKHSQG